ncbi:hypothetical protein KFE25_003050 [Diacronema lutheri]|uniref:Uncharacterized protein n=1 Tax=Diacronema lutheri TaxID=2081491 RepID=A0A7R9UKA4_DIALT|nr:hypothetical protein KFE25_003050 [Diacronema lutheri]|mmetsp:Transcript_12627/g.39752  ORF Transcript_12627/g.39752 Transcript_12627/m.39752 type:complete len:141 (+) Transcript_12627:121-543(+)
MGHAASHDATDELGGALLGAHGPPIRGEQLHPVRPQRPHSLCTQTLFVGKDANGNLCDLLSARYIPAFIVTKQRDQSQQCTQFCLPLQNSLPLKTLLKADIGFCCMQGPGFNNFQGSLNEKVPGFVDVRAWQYTEGESDF